MEDGSRVAGGRWELANVNGPGWWYRPYYNAQGRYIDRNYGNTVNVDKSVCAKAGLDPDIHNTDEFKTRVDAVTPVTCNHIKELGEHLNAICQAITPQDKQVTPTQIKELVIKEMQRLRDLNSTQEQQHKQDLETQNKTIDKLTQENQALKDSHAYLKATLIDLTTLSDSKDKKLASKEAKALRVKLESKKCKVKACELFLTLPISVKQGLSNLFKEGDLLAFCPPVFRVKISKCFGITPTMHLKATQRARKPS
ncbi:hypothetical protein [Helicobacter salomonis]|uniref:hypothetical protein n=1 Tax=Helicobacter salomonis TaxID=56878 RepID=UPI001F2CF42A|nr:hypothetical protein [Helicobacter salomonis]